MYASKEAWYSQIDCYVMVVKVVKVTGYTVKNFVATIFYCVERQPFSQLIGD